MFESCTHCCDIQSRWRGKWVIVGLEETNPKKNWLPQGDHRSRIHISSLISDWYDHVVAMLLTLVHFLSQMVIVSNVQSSSHSLRLKKLNFIQPDNICFFLRSTRFWERVSCKYWWSCTQPKVTQFTCRVKRKLLGLNQANRKAKNSEVQEGFSVPHLVEPWQCVGCSTKGPYKVAVLSANKKEMRLQSTCVHQTYMIE